MAGKSASVKVAILADNSSLTKGLKDSESKLASFGKGVGKAALAAGAAAAVGLGLIAKASVDAASQAQQSIGAVETVFGKFSHAVKRAGREAATDLGLSANAYRENASVLGSLLANQGVAADKLAGKTKGLIKTGADLAATYGGTTTEAVQALASAFKGEFDPLERYGVSIKQSAINTEAMAVAGVTTTKAFDELTSAQQAAAKQTATTNLLTKQTAKTQGAFARESNTLAHQQQVLGAQWDDLKVKLGRALLPALTNVYQALSAELMPALKVLADQYLPQVRRALNEWTKDLDVGRMVGDLGDALADIDWGDVSKGASDLGDSFKDLGPALKDVSADGVSDGFKVFGTTVEFLADHIDVLRKALPYLVTGFLVLKAAQTANQVAGRDSLIGLGLQLIATNRLTVANRELAAAMGGVTRAQGVNAGAMATTTTNVSNLGRAAKVAGGVGGVLGLSASLVNAKDEGAHLGNVLTGALSGAMVGLAVGGPIGGLIGAVGGGGLTALAGSFQDTSDEAKAARLQLLKAEGFTQAKEGADDLREALMGVIHVYGEIPRAATKAKFWDDDGNLGKDIQLLRDAGVSMDTLVSATMGQADAGKIAMGAMDAAMKAAVDNAMEAQRAWFDVKDGVTEYRNEQGVLMTTHVSTADQEAIKAKWEEATGALTEMGVVQDTFYDRIARNTGAIQNHRVAVRALAKDLGISVEQYNAFPKEVRTRFEEEGLPQTVADARRLINQYKGLQNFKSIKAVISAPGVKLTRDQVKKLGELYKLTPKQVRTLFKTEGAKKAESDAQRVGDAVKGAGKSRPDMGPALQKIRQFSLDAKREAITGATGVSDNLNKGTRKAKADLGPFKTSVQTGITSAKSTASTGGLGIGVSLRVGVMAGIAGLGESLSDAVAGAVNAAITAGKRAADAHSPSRKMIKLGVDLGEGLVYGVDSIEPQAERAGRDLVARVYRGANKQKGKGRFSLRFQESLSATKSQLAKVTKAVEKYYDKRIKNDKKAAKASHAAIKALRDEYATLVKNAKLQDQRNRQLDKAEGKLKKAKDLWTDYYKAVKHGAVDYASALQAADKVGFNPTVMLAEMQHRLDKINQFNGILKDLLDKGLSRTIVDQLAQAGVEGGLATALAIQQGGQTAVDEFTKLQEQINAAAGALGSTAADQMYAERVAKAEEQVRKMEARVAHLEQKARKLVRELTRALRRELGVRKPIQGLGLNTRALTGGRHGTHTGRIAAPPTMTQIADPALAAPTVGTTYAITVNAPVGSSPAEIGRTITRYIDAYEKSGGRRRT